MKLERFCPLGGFGNVRGDGRGAILPPKHELGSWQPPMVEMELLRKRWRIMQKMEVHEVDGSLKPTVLA